MEPKDYPIKRLYEKGTQTSVDGWDIPGAPEWADGALETHRVNQEELDTGEVKDEIWISTQNENRSGDLIIATGIKFDDYFKNPVVGWNHGFGDLDFPIGRTTNLATIAGKGVTAEWIWPPWKSVNADLGVERVDDIHRLWQGKFINAASIWIMILSAEPKEGHEDDFWPPLIIHESSMMEWALVYVGRDQNAVRRSMKLLQEHKFLRRSEQRLKRKLQNKTAEINFKGEIRNFILPLPGLNPLQEKLNQLNKSTLELKGNLK